MRFSKSQKRKQPIYLFSVICVASVFVVSVSAFTFALFVSQVSFLAEASPQAETPVTGSIPQGKSYALKGSVLTSRTANGIKDNLLKVRMNADMVWENLVKEGGALLKAEKKPVVAMEVGMHKATQCLQAADAGLEAHCIEPSPTSFQRVKDGIAKASPESQGRVHLYQMAAGGSSEGTIPFTASGGTGDHVGGHDMWKMESSPSERTGGQVIEVPSVRLDDIVEKTDGTFLLKVDTQGFEPAVFSGLTDSLLNHRIQYILFEYWPRGMDLLVDKRDSCVAADLLENMVRAGYTLYALPVVAHPKAPQGWQSKVQERPLGDIRANCEWYFHLEEQFPSEEYKMGYWSDILAVAPGARIDNPTTKLGKALQ